MGRLARVELRRYLSRAAVRWLVVAMLAAVLITTFSAWRVSPPPTQAQVTWAQQQLTVAQSDWAQHREQYLADCRSAQQAQQAQLAEAQQPGSPQAIRCEAIAPKLEDFLPPRPTFADSADGWLGSVATFVLLLSLIVGATFVAAEFSTGSIATWLTFEPRRGHVFASKAAVVSLATGVVALVVSALAVGGFWVATAVHHASGDVTAQTLTDLGNQSARITAAAAGAALVGAVLAFLLRHTAAVVAVVIAWAIAFDQLLATSLLHAPRWALTTNLEAWLHGGTTYYQEGPCVPDPLGGLACHSLQVPLSMTTGGLTLVVLVAVVTGLALLVFRRRDVA